MAGSWENYDDVLEQLRGAGLDVTSIELNTPRPVRCKEIDGDREKRGWYWLNDIELTSADGNRAWFIVGAFGIYRGNDNGRMKVELKRERAKLSSEQRAAIKARQDDMRRRQKAMRKAEIDRAANQARKAWAAYIQDGESRYLDRKRVKAHGLRYSPQKNGTLAVPMLDVAGRIWGLQIIRDNPGRKLAKEYWPKGLDKVGRFFLIGSPQSGGVLLLAEGYATGATLHEVSGLPVAIAFDAGNLLPVAKALRDGYPGLKVLVCADDDDLQKCHKCKAPNRLVDHPETCHQCGELHNCSNAGIECAKAAAYAVAGAHVAPVWPFDRGEVKLTDFNDLAVHPEGGPHLVRGQVWDAVRSAGWAQPRERVSGDPSHQGGGEKRGALSIMPLADCVERFLPIDDGTGKALFDSWTQKLVLREQMLTLLPAGIRWDDVKRDPTWINRGSYFLDQVGFDPGGEDANIRLNTFTGWPSEPAKGECQKTLDLLRYLCSGEDNGDEIFNWMLKWLAYPLQHPGAKMKSALVVHGPQGTGKSRFFEAIADLYGEYGIVLNQGAIEDKFNSDWSSRKLFIVADEIVARTDMYHIKNQLKSFITGDWIRVNPKNLPAYRERNHMNIVFLSNERQPVVLENDDRRHCVIWTPPALPAAAYDAVTAELAGGGLAGLHQYLLDLDLGEFKPWTRPPRTGAKDDLQELGLNSVERFVQEWRQLQVEDKDGNVLPLCPCLGSHLFKVYQDWCATTGSRSSDITRLVGHLKKLHGWSAGKAVPVWNNWQARQTTTRRLVVPSLSDMMATLELTTDGAQEKLQRDQFDTQKDWLTHCFFTFKKAGGFDQ